MRGKAEGERRRVEGRLRVATLESLASADVDLILRLICCKFWITREAFGHNQRWIQTRGPQDSIGKY